MNNGYAWGSLALALALFLFTIDQDAMGVACVVIALWVAGTEWYLR